jgi:hypothetical protein
MKYALLFLVFILTFTQAEKMTPNQLWNTLHTNPYNKLPQYKVSFGKLFTWSKDHILNDAKRTLESRDDLLPPFEKLAHPNGVCLRGTWHISQDNPYSGYFKKGKTSLMVARVSSAMSATKRGEVRAFGFAGKLFGTTNPNHSSNTPTANFFTIDDLGGTRAKHFSDVALTNKPPVSSNSEVIKYLLYALKVTKAFSTADSHPNMRQLYEISQLGETGKVHTPTWLRLTTKTPLNQDALDFRDELTLKAHQKWVFDIEVSSQKKDKHIVWQHIGTITLEDSVTSKSCDQRLHFHHPKWKDN